MNRLYKPFILIFSCILLLCSPAWAKDEVQLQLRWEPQFQFAGFYAALWNGYYDEADLNVTIRSAVQPNGAILEAVTEVATGRSDFGIGGADILLGLDQGYPLRILASYFQDSAVGFFTFPPTELKKASDFIPLVIASSPGDIFDVELRALLKSNGLNPAKVKRLPRKSALTEFLEGKIDVMTGYVFGVPQRIADYGRKVNVARSSDFGVRIYGDSLFTSKRMLDHHPDVVQRFVEASQRGWVYALKNPVEVTQKLALLPRVRAVKDPKSFNRRMAADVIRLMDFPRINPGHMTLERWEGGAQTLFQAGVLRAMPDMQKVLLDPERDYPTLWQRNQLWFYAGLFAFLLLGGSLHIVSLRRAVRRATDKIASQGREMAQQKAVLDTLFTDLPVGVALFDDRGNALQVNPAFDHVVSAPVEPIRTAGGFWQHLLPNDEEADRLASTVATTSTSKKLDSVRLETPAGIQWLDARWLSLPDHGLRVAMVQDVSQRQTQRQELESSEKRFRSLFDNAAVASCEVDWTDLFARLRTLERTGSVGLEKQFAHDSETVLSLLEEIRILRINQACLDLYGAATTAELTERMDQVFHTESISAFATCLLSIYRGESTCRVESRWLTLNGEERFIRLSATRLPMMTETINVLLTMQDLTALTSAHQKIEESQQRYEAIFRSAEMAIWDEDFRPILKQFQRWRADGISDIRAFFSQNPEQLAELASLITVNDVNQATLRLFGAEQAEELIANIDQQFTDQAQGVFRDLVYALWDGEESFHAEAHYRTLTGQDIRTLVHASLPRRVAQAGHVPVCMADITPMREIELTLQRRESQYRKMFENAYVGIWDEDYTALPEAFAKMRMEGVDDLGTYLLVNPAEVERLRSLVIVNEINQTGIKQMGATSREDILENQARIWTEDAFTHFGEFLNALWQGDESFSCDCTYNTLDEKSVTLQVSIQIPESKEDWQHIPICLLDVTKARQTQARLSQLSHAVEQTSAQVIITDTDGIIEYVNPAFEKGTGYDLIEVAGKSPGIVKSNYTSQQTYQELWSTISQGQVWQGELYNKKKDGDFYWIYATISPLTNEDGQITNFIAIMEDISLLKEQEMQLMLQAHYDELTGLPNRILIMDRLKQAIRKCERGTSNMAVLFVDLDKFKDINDSLGHNVGDNLLVEAASRIKHAVRASDTVGRFGGDEFIVLIEDCGTMKDVEHVANKINHAFIKEFNINKNELATTASIGIATYPENGQQVEELLKSADAAMYKAKDAGRNTYHFFTASMNSEASQRLTVESRLRHALERDEFFLVYQPLVSAESGKVVGVEALIRWQDAQLGLVMPDQFISLAEGMGKISEIGDWVMRTACRQIADWQTLLDDPLSVAVNVSPRQFSQGTVIESVERALEESGIEPSRLVVEVTENMLIQDHPEIVENLHQLKSLGVTMTVDDFGTGYSSLSYLKRYPFDALKIDRSFVKDLEDSEDSSTLVTAIIAMAEGLGLEVVGEGVETEYQYGFLQQLNCHICQGYYFSRPLLPDAFLEFYRAQED